MKNNLLGFLSYYIHYITYSLFTYIKTFCMITVTIFTWKVFAILAIFQCLSFNRSSYHNVGAEISSTTDDCRLTPAIRRIKYEGCSSKPIPTFGCTGRCSSYLQVYIQVLTLEISFFI